MVLMPCGLYSSAGAAAGGQASVEHAPLARYPCLLFQAAQGVRAGQGRLAGRVCRYWPSVLPRTRVGHRLQSPKETQGLVSQATGMLCSLAACN